MRTIPIPIYNRAYDIVIQDTFFAESACPALGPHVSGRACFIVSDSTVAPLYAESATRMLQAAGADSVTQTIFPAGEESKTHSTLCGLYSAAVEAGLDRKSVVIALGGGVVGDTAGFLAASYMRGIDYIQMSTSLVAHVDSSIGGKTAVDLPEGKNLIGAFHQPKLVMIDPLTLRTLDDRQLRCGLAEVVKYGVILDAALFAKLETIVPQLLARDAETCMAVIQRCCELKADVVLEDEFDNGLRAILNYGHTFGHALEKITGYRLYTHGEAIAIGMAMAADLAILVDATEARRELRTRQDALFAALGLPTRCKRSDGAPEQILAAMQQDKKYEQGKNRLIVPDGIGTVHMQPDVPSAPILEAIRNRCD